jgi:hypothetical protein
MTYRHPAQAAIRPDSVLAGRRRMARIILAVHLPAVLVLFLFLAGTEGPAAQGTPHSVTLAKVQLILIALAMLAEVILTARWAQYALTLRRIQPAVPHAGPRDPWERSAAMQNRAERGAVRVLMAMTVAAVWLAQLAFIPLATYQINNYGLGDPSTDLSTGMFLLTGVLAFLAGAFTGYSWLCNRSRRTTASVFVPLTNPELFREDPDTAVVKLRQAQVLALRWVRFSIGLAVLIVLLFVLAAATGKLDAHIGLMAPVLLLMNASWAARWKKVLDTTRRAEANLLARQAQAMSPTPYGAGYPVWPGAN